MLVKDVMTRDVKTIKPGQTVLAAAEKMKEFRIGCLIVEKNEKLLGILTDSDILDKVTAEDRLASKIKVKDVMTNELVLIEHDATIEQAAELMEERKIKKLPVIKGRKLIGIVTVADMAQAQPKLLKQVSALMVFPKTGKAVAG